MATIPMTDGFQLCPEGEQVFRIYAVDYQPDFGKIEVKMINAQGLIHTERFNLKYADGSTNNKAAGAFSYFARTALNNFTLTEIDHTDLVDHYIKANVIHTELPSNREPGKTVIMENLKEKYPASGFEDTPVERALTIGHEDKPATDPGLNLDDLLGA